MFQPLNEHLIFGMTASKFRRRWEEGVEGEDEREVILKDLNSHLVPEHKVFSTVNVDPIMHNTKCRSRCYMNLGDVRRCVCVGPALMGAR
jgi:hypothetical protein